MKVKTETLEQVVRSFIAVSASSILKLSTTDKRSERIWAVNSLYTGAQAIVRAAEELKNRIYEEEGINHE